MISTRNPSHAIPDTITSASYPPSPRPISSPYSFPPRFPPHRVARLVDLRHDAILPATRSLVLPAYSSRSISSDHLIGSYVSPVACLPYQPHAVAIRLPPHTVHPSHPSHPPRLISSGLSPVPPRFPLCFPPGVPPPPTCPPRSSHPSHPSHPLRSISLAHRPAPSDETSDEQAKRRTRRAINNGEAERHDIRRLTDTANTPPRLPYSPYKPHNARTPTRTRPR